ncbi:hypothetical protein D9M71_402900 [compost metagenome]
MTDVEAKTAHHQGRCDHTNEDAWHAFEALEHQDQGQGSGADDESGPIGLPCQQCLTDVQHFTQGAAALYRDIEQLRRLADQYREGDTVQVTVANGF